VLDLPLGGDPCYRIGRVMHLFAAVLAQRKEAKERASVILSAGARRREDGMSVMPSATDDRISGSVSLSMVGRSAAPEPLVSRQAPKSV
jgi:hypothetical protein